MSRTTLSIIMISVLATFFAVSEGYQFPLLYPYESQSPSLKPRHTPKVRDVAPASPSASTTFSVTPSSTPSVSRSSTPAPSKSRFPLPSKSPEPSPSASVLPAPSISSSPSASETQNPSSSGTPAPSTSTSPSLTPSSSVSPTPSNSGSPSLSKSANPSSTPSGTAPPTPSNSGSVSPSSSANPSTTASNSATPSAKPPRTVPGSGSCTSADFAIVKNRLRNAVSVRTDRHRWPARLLFLAFHDCLPQKCDASIVFEQHRPPNRKVGVTLSLLNRVRGSTCVSLADTIKIGLELSMELSGGPSITCPKGTKDATRSNPDGLPGPGESFLSLIRKFTAHGGITPIEAISANYGGHALGGFGVHPVSGMPAFNFTNNANVFNNRYCVRTLMKATLPDQSDILTLRSDDTLALNLNLPAGSRMPAGISVPRNLRMPRELQGMTGINNRRPRTGKDVVALFAASNTIFSLVFKSFLEKLCSL